VQAWAQRLTTANHAALIFSLEPFFAALFAFWILGQVLTLREWAGGVLVLSGILVSELQFPFSPRRR
jgi:drug/metabolite transporter (DMT)-like permease